MFDTMTATKIAGAVCGTFLIFLLGNWAAEGLYHVGSSDHGGGHGDEDHGPKYAYIIEVEDEDHGGADAEAEPAVPFAELFAAADPVEGEGLWRACRSCHKVEDGQNGTGPHLFGIVGRNVAAVDGFNYSGKLIAVNDVWSAEELDAFLEDPKGYAPGTKMSYNGMRDAEDRANLIAWLDSLDN